MNIELIKAVSLLTLKRFAIVVALIFAVIGGIQAIHCAFLSPFGALVFFGAVLIAAFLSACATIAHHLFTLGGISG